MSGGPPARALTCPAVHVHQLIPAPVLLAALTDGLVRRQEHPELPLAILNYTERAAYQGTWNEATLNSRGLIVNTDTGDIVARPFPKFFNYGQPGAPDLDLDAPAAVTEKVDGSLGILYPRGDGRWAVATRGSFTSDQAIHATELWDDVYQFAWQPGPLEGFTYLFEIVYPANRIVCDYGDLDDLVLLAAIDNETGMRASPRMWPGPRVSEHPYRTLAEALAAEPRPNAEGLVVNVYQPDAPGALVKIKQEDYVALHRIVTGLNKRTVWQHIDAGLPIDELIEPLPDEFRPWVEDVVAELSALVAAQAREIEREFFRITAEVGMVNKCSECGGELAWVVEASDNAVPENAGFVCTTSQCKRQWQTIDVRKEFALRAKESPWSWALFNRLDGRDYGPKLWHNARPDPVTPAGRVYTQDAA